MMSKAWRKSHASATVIAMTKANSTNSRGLRPSEGMMFTLTTHPAANRKVHEHTAQMKLRLTLGEQSAEFCKDERQQEPDNTDEVRPASGRHRRKSSYLRALPTLGQPTCDRGDEVT